MGSSGAAQVCTMAEISEQLMNEIPSDVSKTRAVSVPMAAMPM